MPNYLLKTTVLSPKLFLRMLLCVFLFVGFQSVAQQTDIVDFLKIEATITPNPKTKSISGEVELIFKILKDTDSVYLDAKNMNVVDFNAIKFKFFPWRKKKGWVKRLASVRNNWVNLNNKVIQNRTSTLIQVV